jgi:GntR family transcriptional regulator
VFSVNRHAQPRSANLISPQLTSTYLVQPGLAWPCPSSYCDRVKIDSDSPEHPYVQLAGLLRDRIKAGKIGPRVPSIMELADETGLSAATVKRALRLLRDEELIYTVPGRGTFVRKG